MPQKDVSVPAPLVPPAPASLMGIIAPAPFNRQASDPMAPTAPLELSHIVARIDAGASRASSAGVPFLRAPDAVRPQIAELNPPRPSASIHIRVSSLPDTGRGMPRMTAVPSNEPSNSPLPFSSPGVSSKRPSSGTSYLPEDAPEKGATVAPGQFEQREVTPFRGAAQVVSPDQVDLSMFPLERYAEVVVALAAQEPRQTVLRRFVLDEEMWTAVASAWAQRLGSEPELQRAFAALIRRERSAR